MNKLRDDICRESQKWLGAKWHHSACVPYSAVDCAQLLAAVYSTTGFIEKPEFHDYPRDWALHRQRELFLERVLNYAHEVTHPLSGDIILFKVGRTFSHSAIVLDYPRIIHAEINAGVIYADCTTGELGKRQQRYFTVF